MSAGLLAVVALAQSVLVLGVLLVLGASHWLGSRRDRRHAAEKARVDEIARRLATRDLLPEEAIDALDALGFDSVSQFLKRYSAHRRGADGERMVSVLRRTRWHRRIQTETESRFWWRRLQAARALSNLAAAEDLATVHRLLIDPVPAVRLAAADTLARLPSPALAAAILDRATAGHTVVRNHLLEILASSRAVVLPVMVTRLGQSLPPWRLRALVDLAGLLADPRLLPHVIAHSDSGHLEVRIAAATSLRSYPHPQAAAALRRLLRDPAWQVRARAAASLGAIEAIEAVDDLCATLCDRNWWVRLRSAIALRLVGPSGVHRLRAMTPELDRYGYDMACYVLELDDAAMAEYVGGATIDYSGAPTGAVAA
jgi:hypothetical protein